MVKLIVDNSNRRPKLVIMLPDPQEHLDELCIRCFLVRGQYLGAISKTCPFTLDRAEQVMNIMLEKGFSDPRAFALGTEIRRHWQRFSSLS